MPLQSPQPENSQAIIMVVILVALLGEMHPVQAGDHA